MATSADAGITPILYEPLKTQWEQKEGVSKMNSFSYSRAQNAAGAAGGAAANPKAMLTAGGTNLLDLMKVNVIKPYKSLKEESL